MRATFAAVRARASAEDGVTLIEILVSAVMLIVIITGVFRAFDAAGHITGFEQQRSQAQAIAQQDEDNIRALPVAQLDGLNKTYTTTAGKTQYTVVEKAQFQSEATGSSACSAQGSADVIKTTSTVSWAPGVTSGPKHAVTASSIVSTPAGGALIVQILDANGNPVSGTTVTATGPASDPGGGTTASLTSGPDGCAIFAGLAGGTYTVNASEPGYVDPNGNTTASAQETVVEGTSVPTGGQLDKAGTLPATFAATGTNAAGALMTFADTMTIANQGMAIPGTRTVGTIGTPFAGSPPAASVTNAFPFPSGYTMYAGSCAQDDPATYTGVDDASVQVNAAATQILMPAIKVTLYSGTSKSNPGSLATNTTVTFNDTGCSVTRTAQTNSSGYVNVAAPYGTYTLSTVRSGTTYQVPNLTNNSAGLTECMYRGLGASTIQTGAC